MRAAIKAEGNANKSTWPLFPTDHDDADGRRDDGGRAACCRQGMRRKMPVQGLPVVRAFSDAPAATHTTQGRPNCCSLYPSTSASDTTRPIPRRPPPDRTIAAFLPNRLLLAPATSQSHRSRRHSRHRSRGRPWKPYYKTRNSRFWRKTRCLWHAAVSMSGTTRAFSGCSDTA